MAKRFILGGLAAAGLALSGHSLWAQEAETAPARVSELDTMVVTADRTPTPIREVTQSVNVITEEEIRRSGADNVTDLLKKYGIQVYNDGAEGYGSEGIVMRGGRTSMHGFDLAGDILVLVDGRRTGSDFFSNLDMGNTARIEVIRGPGAVQYGAAAMGGVINIITKRGAEKTAARLEAGLGSWGERRVQGGFSGRAGSDQQLDFSASASYYTRDGYKLGDGSHYDNSDLDYRTRYNLNLGWNFNERHRLGFALQGSRLKDAGKGPDSSTRGTSAYRHTRQNRDTYTFDVSYEGRTEDDSKFWLARYYQGEISYDLSRFYTHVNYNARLPFSDSENTFRGAQAQFGWDLGRFEFVTGADWVAYDFDQSQSGTSATTANFSSSDFENYGAFILAKVHLLEDRRLTLSAGLRYDDFDVSIDSTRGRPVLNTTSSSSQVDTWTPSVGLAYNPVDWLKLRANYSQAFKMPTPRQMGALFYMNNLFVGNPDLKPEESDNWDLGFDVNYQALTLSATYFHSKYDNMIDYDYMNTPEYGWANYYINRDRAAIRGVEVGGAFDFGEYFDWNCLLEPYVYYTHLIKFEDGNGWKLPNRARNTLSYGVKFNHEDIGLTINLDATYYGAQYKTVRDSVNTSPTYGEIVDDARLKDVGNATIWDLNVSKRLYRADDFGDISVKVALKNIFDKKYATNEEDQWMPGASAYVGLVWNY